MLWCQEFGVNSGNISIYIYRVKGGQCGNTKTILNSIEVSWYSWNKNMAENAQECSSQSMKWKEGSTGCLFNSIMKISFISSVYQTLMEKFHFINMKIRYLHFSMSIFIDKQIKNLECVFFCFKNCWKI